MQATDLNPNRIAAILYDDGVAVDALMTTFARELRDSGAIIGGVVQLPPEEAGCGPGAPMRLQDVHNGEIISICQDLGPGSGACKLDPAGLAEAGVRVRAASDAQADVVFVSRFGKQEKDGRGLSADLAYAAGEGRIVLTAVRRGLVHNWLEFTGGVGTLLDARLWVLREWWNDGETRPAGRSA